MNKADKKMNRWDMSTDVQEKKGYLMCFNWEAVTCEIKRVGGTEK